MKVKGGVRRHNVFLVSRTMTLMLLIGLYGCNGGGDTPSYYTDISSASAITEKDNNTIHNGTTFATTAPLPAGVCFAAADTGDILTQVFRFDPNPATNENTIGKLGVVNVEAIALQPNTGVLYAANAGQLGTVSTSTGVFTATSQPFGTGTGALGSITFSDVDGLSFDRADGTLYGAHRRSDYDVLIKINPTTGTHINDAFGAGVDYVVLRPLTGDTPLRDIDDLAVDPTDGRLYAIANNSGTVDGLVMVEKSGADAGRFTFVGANLAVPDMEGLSFESSGQLIGISGASSVAGRSNSVWEINKTTGVVNLGSQAQLDNGADYEGIACLPSTPVIPTTTTTSTTTTSTTTTTTTTSSSTTSTSTTTTTTIPEFLLTVNKTGNGSGTVVSSPQGVNCGAICSASFLQGTEVILIAVPDVGASFIQWSGECKAINFICIATMSAARSVTVEFGTTPTPTTTTTTTTSTTTTTTSTTTTTTSSSTTTTTTTLPDFLLAVNKTGNGSGTVDSNPSGVACGATCAALFSPNTQVILRAVPDTDSTFVRWSGECSGTSDTCLVTMSAAKLVIAEFSTTTTTTTTTSTTTTTTTTTTSTTTTSTTTPPTTTTSTTTTTTSTTSTTTTTTSSSTTITSTTTSTTTTTEPLTTITTTTTSTTTTTLPFCNKKSNASNELDEINDFQIGYVKKKDAIVSTWKPNPVSDGIRSYTLYMESLGTSTLTNVGTSTLITCSAAATSTCSYELSVSGFHRPTTFLIRLTAVDGQGQACLASYRTVNTGWMWVKQDTAYDVAQGIGVDERSDKIYVTGHTFNRKDKNTGAGKHDAFLLRYDPESQRELEFQRGTEGDDSGNGVAIDPDTALSTIYMAGWTDGALDTNANAGPWDSFLMKYQGDGTSTAHQWTTLAGTAFVDYASAVAADPVRKAIYVTGYTNGDLDGNQPLGGLDLFLIKYDEKGEKQWTRQYGTTKDDFATGVAVNSTTGDIYITGWTTGDFDITRPNAGGSDFFLIRYDDAGNLLSTRQMGTFEYDFATGIAVENKIAGAIYLTGWTSGALTGEPSAGDTDIFIVKVDATGEQWIRQIGTEFQDKALGIALDRIKGNIYITGWTLGDFNGNKNAGLSDYILIKYNENGDKQWVQQSGNSSIDVANAVAVNATTGAVYIAGWTLSDLLSDTDIGGGESSSVFTAKFLE